MDLPVLDVIPALREELHRYPLVILQAPPGAGKSTVVPLQLVDEPWLKGKKIIMLEPRRLAARSVAERMSTTLSQPEKIGESIGYRIRFDTKAGPKTRIEVVTEGILTRMIQSDNSLEEVGLLIFDEFHERNLHGDLALALSLQIQQVLRPDLKILIMSATLDTVQLSEKLGRAPVISSDGKIFPVDIGYAKEEEKISIPKQMAKAVQKALREESGDILAFLPGAWEIRECQSLLEASSIGASVHPLFGDLNFRQQEEAILPRRDGVRKVVLATSIAETSLTIEGIRVVIDSGYSRLPRFDPRSGLTRLETVRVTLDSADQRTGRAGRLGPGVCYRLWTPATQRNLLPQRKPEILEADLASLVLDLAQWGIKDANTLTWITVPPAGAISQARELLMNLEAIDQNGITGRGKRMQNLPTHPRIAHMLEISASDPAALALSTDVAAVLEERDPLENHGSDLSLRIEILRKWRKGERVNAKTNVLERIERLASNWRKIFKLEMDNTTPEAYATGKLLLLAYPERIARQQKKNDGTYTLSNGRAARLPEHDPQIHETWLCIAELDLGAKSGKIFSSAPVDERDLISLSRDYDVVRWDEEHEKVVASMEKRVGGLVLETKAIHKIPEDQKNQVIIGMIREKGLRIFNWDQDALMLRNRMQSIFIWRPDEGWPDMSDEKLLSTLETWLEPFLAGIYKLSEIEKIDFPGAWGAQMPYAMQKRIDILAPKHIAVPSGSNIQVQYFMDGRPPVMEVRLQELFGMQETPTVNEGNVKILMHLLSPGYKPVQVTQDLKSFWNSIYHEVRKELRMRYPKHSWPEDPWTAQAVRGVRRKM